MSRAHSSPTPLVASSVPLLLVVILHGDTLAIHIQQNQRINQRTAPLYTDTRTYTYTYIYTHTRILSLHFTSLSLRTYVLAPPKAFPRPHSPLHTHMHTLSSKAHIHSLTPSHSHTFFIYVHPHTLSYTHACIYTSCKRSERVCAGAWFGTSRLKDDAICLRMAAARFASFVSLLGEREREGRKERERERENLCGRGEVVGKD